MRENISKLLEISSIVVFLLSSCKYKINNNYEYNDIIGFKKYDWELAKAVEKQDLSKIDRLLQHDHNSVNMTEDKFGQSILQWAVENDKYESVKKLLEMSANPNVFTKVSPSSPLIVASLNDSTSKYIRILIKYGANPNLVVLDSNVFYPSPLIAAATVSLENTKILINSGAMPNYKSKFGRSALLSSILSSQVQISQYLLLEKKVDYTIVEDKTIDGGSRDISDLLRYWVFDLNSEDYKIKMAIVQYLKANGIDYFKSEIPSQLYNNYSVEYLKQY